ncbi:phi LC3 family holin [Lysinibacillus composti]|uniref:Phage holin n=1 Tax=Lysinibacillus composti TaxID=720633 RepID=A0A3N9UJW6_9BACI|nr:phage holin [Lysinibacillus composti]MBM7607165.1 phi LC3 family holin [Lysinibacillus composti]RQW76247.1 phage holin [Lysinibacillus composti]
MNINWKVRLQHRQFWLSIISLLIILANQVGALFGYDITLISEQVEEILGTVLMIFVMAGIIVDPTTEGLSDSKQALTYKKPKSKK